MARSRHRASAQSIIETVVGIIFLIPIVLFLFDVGVLVLANTANDTLAKQCARAAASATPPQPNDQPTPGNVATFFPPAAKTAAENVVTNYAPSGKNGYLNDITLAKMYYNGAVVPVTNASTPTSADTDPGPGNVACFTKVRAVAPVPFPGFDTSRIFYAKATEPIVAIPPTLGP